jgi:hypothetical protein
MEVGEFLRRLIIEHANCCHPERFTPALLDDGASSFTFRVTT